MNRLLLSLTPAVLCANLFGIAPTLARDLKTMRFENDLPRPAGVDIADARADQVVLYCTQANAGCQGLRAHFAKLGLDYVDKDPQADPQAGAEFDALGGQGIPLVVFKQRLMHGYYPSSFDTLYAQYHTGSKPSPAQAATPATAGARQTASHPVPAFDATAANPAETIGTVETVEPAAIAATIHAHPDLVLQLTSPDARCGHCVASYQGFDAAARTYGRRIKFARVAWSPWTQLPKEVTAIHDGGYAPTQLAFRSGKKTGEFDGNLMNRSREFGAFLKRTYALGDGYPDSAVAVDEIGPDNLAAYLRTHPNAVIQFTSPDPNCGPCARAYAGFEETASVHGRRVSFARVQWLRWNQPPEGIRETYKLRAVPQILAIEDGQVVDRLAGSHGKARLSGWIEQRLVNAR